MYFPKAADMDTQDTLSENTEASMFINPAVGDMDLDVNTSKWKDYCCSHREEKHKTDSYRKGPAPIEEYEVPKSDRKSTDKATYGTLDSDVEDIDFEEERVDSTVGTATDHYNKKRSKTNAKGDSLASCKALIVYFSKLAKTKDENETIDLNFVDSLLQSGADINFPDKHGQCIIHEISRGWHPDVAKFAIQHGADINKADYFGRTALHLAAAVDYEEMVEFLVQNGANLGAKSLVEVQTPMHYAAKNNAAASLKIMLRLGAHINDRDYKRRTPLFVAAESARAEAARFLIEQGAPAGVYDSSGTPCLSLMIEKMPQIAMEAVEQFHLLDRAFRKHYYYLSYLEPDPKFLGVQIPDSKREKKELKERQKEEKRLMKEAGKKKFRREKTYAKTPLEVIVQYNQLDLVMHPVFQRLLHVKWSLFGKLGSTLMLMLNLFYTLIWTVLGILIPRDRKYYQPINERWWRLVFEIIGVLLTGHFIFVELFQLRVVEKAHNRWRQWRTRHVEKDLKFCHPRWPEEKKYLESELAQIRTFQRTYFREPWNIFEWIAYFVILTLVMTRILSVASGDKLAEEIHPRIYALGLIVIWLRFMRSCRAFRSLGPFIAILGSVIADTMKFAFLFFEFFIPYTVGFWILFGGPEHAKIMQKESAQNWEKFNDLMFSVWSMTLMGDFDFDGLVKVDRLMAQILCGTYFALASVVCMNLYIALLSDTFARVYSQAKANAVMQQAVSVINLEGKLSKKKRLYYGHYMQNECNPEEVYSRDEGNSPDDHENDMFEKVTRSICNRIDEMEDSFKRQNFSSPIGKDGGGGGRGPGGGGAGGLLDLFNNQSGQIQEVKREIEELKKLMVRFVKQMPTTDSKQKTLPPPTANVTGSHNIPPMYPTLPQSLTTTASDHTEKKQVRMPPQPQNSYNQPQLGNPSYAYPPPPGQNYPPHLTPQPGYHNQQPLHQGYITDPERDMPGGGRGRRGKRRRRGKRNGGNGYDSDSNSAYSENMPMQYMPRNRSPQSIQSAPGSNKKKNKKNGPKNLTGSWEDIRNDVVT